jgi:hypothetical protein
MKKPKCNVPMTNDESIREMDRNASKMPFEGLERSTIIC